MNERTNEDMNSKQLGQFSSVEDDHKLKYMQKSYFFDSPCMCRH